MAIIAERVDTLENVLKDFIINTNAMFDRIEATQNRTQATLDKHDKNLDRLEKDIDKLIMEQEKQRVEQDKQRAEMEKQRVEQEKQRVEQDKQRAEMDKQRAEMDKQRGEMDKQRIKMDDFIKEMRDERRMVNKQLGEMSNKMGTMDEDLISPAVRPVLNKYFNCDINYKGIRILKHIKDESFEVDVLAACKDKVFMIETRSTPRSEYVGEVLKKATKFKKFFSEYKDKELIPILACLIFPENVIKYATRKGLYLMAYREWEYMDIINFDEVKQILQTEPVPN